MKFTFCRLCIKSRLKSLRRKGRGGEAHFFNIMASHHGFQMFRKLALSFSHSAQKFFTLAQLLSHIEISKARSLTKNLNILTTLKNLKNMGYQVLQTPWASLRTLARYSNRKDDKSMCKVWNLFIKTKMIMLSIL